MRKFISAVTSLAMAATMATSIVPATSIAADATKGLAIKTYAESGSSYASMGSTVEVKASDVAAGDVTIPCAVYIDEQTADSQGISIQFTVNGGAGAGDIVFKSYKPTESYFSAAKAYTAGGASFSTKQAITFAGTYDEDIEEYQPAGMYQINCVKGSKAANTPNYFYGLSWTAPVTGYTHLDAKSTDHPFLVFDVTLPKGIAEGTYTLDFLTYNTSDKAGVNNPATMIETSGRYMESDGNLKLEGMTIKVGDSATPSETTTTKAAAQTTTTAQTPVQTTTTKAAVTPGNSDIVLDFGDYEATPGEALKVNVMINSNGNPICGGDFVIDSPFDITKITESCPALGCPMTVNPAEKTFNFGCPDSEGNAINSDDSKKFAVLTLDIPADAAPGTYKIGLGSKAELIYNNHDPSYSIEAINGNIVIKGDVQETTTTAAPVQTTTTTTTTQAPVQTTTTSNTNPDKLVPLWGDTNCDKTVNVADVVVLNKWLNDNSSYAITDQGKVNADCCNPQDMTGGAVDPSKVDLTAADSNAIIRSIVSLVTLPINN